MKYFTTSHHAANDPKHQSSCRNHISTSQSRSLALICPSIPFIFTLFFKISCSNIFWTFRNGKALPSAPTVIQTKFFLGIFQIWDLFSTFFRILNFLNNCLSFPFCRFRHRGSLFLLWPLPLASFNLGLFQKGESLNLKLTQHSLFLEI